MNLRALPFQSQELAPSGLSLSDFLLFADGWLLDCDIRQHSKATIANRTLVIEKFKWFCAEKKIAQVSTLTMRQFLAYVSRGHEQPGGKWANAQCVTQVKPGTVASYHRILRALDNWTAAEMETQGRAYAPLMRNVAAPVDRPDDIEPFTESQVDALLAAARKSPHPKRDEAVVSLLLDTGLRASEIASLRFAQLDMTNRKITIDGKGGKTRPVYFGAKTKMVLWRYLSEDTRDDHSAVFLADKGILTGEGLTRNGFSQLIRRLGKAAHIEGTRCSPHTFRHTFAIEFLRNGGNQFTLMQLLGHTDVKMTSRYVKVAQADVANQHRQYSPMDRRKRKK